MAESEKNLRCPRCGTVTPVSEGQCTGCGLKIVRKKRQTEEGPPRVETIKPDATRSTERKPSQPSSPAKAAPASGGAKTETAKPAATKPAAKPADAKAQAAKPVEKKPASQPPSQVKPAAVALKPTGSGMHMPKLQIAGLERHDDAAREIEETPSSGMKMLDGLETQRSPKDTPSEKHAEDDIRSFLMDTSEVDGHGVQTKSSEKAATREVDMSEWMLSPSETFGEDSGNVAPASNTERLSEKIGFKAHYQDENPTKPETLVGAGAGGGYSSPGGGSAPAATVIDEMMKKAGFGESNVSSGYDMPFDPQQFQKEETFRGMPNNAPRKALKDGLTDEELFLQIRRKQGRRRLMTRTLTWVLICFAFWFAGKNYGLPFLLVQGDWDGQIMDIDEVAANFTVHFDRVGRQLTGTVKFDLPKNKDGLIEVSKTPKIIREIFTSDEGNVIGEFDLHKLRVKVYTDDPDTSIELVGDIRRSPQYHLIVRGDAINCQDSEAQFALLRPTLW